MKKEKLNSLVEFLQGTNQSRVMDREQYKKLYDNTAFNVDYENMKSEFLDFNDKSETDYLKVGDVVINISAQLASIVSPENQGKILSINFIKVIFKTDRLDKGYFIYLFNSNKEIKKIKERESYSSGLVQRITIKSLNGIDIPLVTNSMQKSISELYLKTNEMKKNLLDYSKLIEQATNMFLEEKTR